MVLVQTWSPSAEEQRIHRRYLQISRKQQTLLNREDAWSAGSARVPRDVLTALESIPAPKAVSTAVVEDRTTLPSEVEAQAQETPRQEVSSHDRSLGGLAQDPRQSQANGEETGTPIPWTPSPPRPVRRPSPAEEPISQPQLPEPRSSSPPTHHPTPKPVSKALYLPMPTSSSVVSLDLEEDEPLVTVTNSAQPVVPVPARVAAVSIPEPTPPSAQIIPGTCADGGTPARPPPAKRQRLMKPLERKFSPELYRPSEVSLPTESLSNQLPWTASRIPSSSLPARALLVDPSYSVPQTTSSTSVSRLSGAGGQAPLDAPVATCTARPLSGDLEVPPPNGPRSQVPFIAFMVAYRDYQCTLNTFLRGVKAIRDVRDRERLPAFLYDDLMRVFCGDYMDYIEKLGPEEKPLTLVRWYNRNVSSFQYMQGILTIDNLDRILDQHPDPDGKHSENPARVDPAKDAEALPPASLSSNPKPSASAAVPTPRATHVAELASDPIEIVENTQPRRESRLPSPDLSIPNPQTPNLPPRASTSAASREHVEPVASRMQTQADFSLHSSQQSKRRRPVEDYTPVPETLLRPKDSNRPPIDSASSVLRKNKELSAQELRTIRLRKHFEKTIASSAPRSSMGR